MKMTIKKRRSSHDRDERRYVFVVPPLFRSSFACSPDTGKLSKMIPHYQIRSAHSSKKAGDILSSITGDSPFEHYYRMLYASGFFSSSQAHSSTARRSVLTNTDSLDFCDALYSSCSSLCYLIVFKVYRR